MFTDSTKNFELTLKYHHQFRDLHRNKRTPFLRGNPLGYLPPIGGYVRLESAKNRTPSWVLKAGEPRAPSKGNLWNPSYLGPATVCRWPPFVNPMLLFYSAKKYEYFVVLMPLSRLTSVKVIDAFICHSQTSAYRGWKTFYDIWCPSHLR